MYPSSQRGVRPQYSLMNMDCGESRMRGECSVALKLFVPCKRIKIKKQIKSKKGKRDFHGLISLTAWFPFLRDVARGV